MEVLFFVLSTIIIFLLIILITEKPKRIDHEEWSSNQQQDNWYIQVTRMDGSDNAGRPTANRPGPQVIRTDRSPGKIKVRAKERQDRKCFYCAHTNKMVPKQYVCELCSAQNGTDKEVCQVFE